jgi:hypothetical protein
MAPIQPPNSLKKKTNYWDTLSQPPLTRNALKEVQRRVAKPAYGPLTYVNIKRAGDFATDEAIDLPKRPKLFSEGLTKNG